jgi:hypothetical protein
LIAVPVVTNRYSSAAPLTSAVITIKAGQVPLALERGTHFHASSDAKKTIAQHWKSKNNLWFRLPTQFAIHAHT